VIFLWVFWMKDMNINHYGGHLSHLLCLSIHVFLSTKHVISFIKFLSRYYAKTCENNFIWYAKEQHDSHKIKDTTLPVHWMVWCDWTWGSAECFCEAWNQSRPLMFICWWGTCSHWSALPTGGCNRQRNKKAENSLETTATNKLFL
jgi:hypothetical protein